MPTTFADRLQQGVGFAEKLVNDAPDVLPSGTADRFDARIARIGRRARRGMERASDVRDEARIAIKRHPFAATAFAFGLGTLIGVVVGRLARAGVRETAATHEMPVEALDLEC